MELKPMRSEEMQEAYDSEHVQKIVKFLLQEKDEIIFSMLLQFLRSNSSPISLASQKLQALRNSLQGRTDSQGNFITRSDLDELLRTIADMYEEEQKRLDHMRGAIVELLTAKLISFHCGNDECYTNHGFVDNELSYKSPEIDVAVLSKSANQIEGYSCKMISKQFTLKICEDLLKLSHYSQKGGFRTHLGAVSFDRSEIIARNLGYLRHMGRYLNWSSAINVYGSDNIKELRKNPFGK